MAKHRPSLEAFAQSAGLASKQDVPPAQPAAPAPSPASRMGRAHTTLYLDRRVQKVIKEIALLYDRKPHDLYLEGIDMMLAHYGRPSVKDIAK